MHGPFLRPSIFSDPNGPTEGGNYLDPAKHSLTLGWGLKYQHFLGFETGCQLDFNVLFQHLPVQHVVKSPGNEVGNLSDLKIGAPGYDAGGNILGGGVSLSLAF